MTRRTLVVSLLAGAALAQDAVPPNRFVPAGAQVVLRIKAPAVWQEQFANTQLAKVFAGPTFAPLRKQAREKYPEALDRAAAAGMPREVLQALLEDYRGELLVSVQFDIDAMAASGSREHVPFAVMLALTPDGKFDLAALLAGFRKVDEKYEGPVSPLQIGEHTFRVSAHDVPVTQAELVDGHLVMFGGTAIEKLAPGMLAAANRAERLPADAPWALHVDLAGAIDASVAVANAQLEAAEMPAQQIFDAMGITALDAFDASLGTAGEHVELVASLSTRSRSVGLYGLLFADTKKPALLRYVPPSVSSFSVSSFDFATTVRAILAIVELAGRKEQLAQTEASFREKAKLRLREDLLDHVGGEVMLLGDLREFVAQVIEAESDGTRPDPNRLFADYCIGIALHDGAAFATSIETLLRSVGLHAARKTEQYRNTKIHELRLGGAVTVEYAIVDDLALCVVGARGNGAGYLRAALDAHADGNASPALPEAIAKRLDGVPDGWNGIGTMPVVDLVLGFAELGSMRRPEVAVREGLDFLRPFGKELKELGLGDVVSVSYSSPKGLRTIYRW
ncbi:MAG TPA: hypothetical protein VF384_12030 [Planctomycetota bacterium]